MTKRENYTELKALATASNRPELVAFIDHELELLDKKNKGSKKPTKTQIANEVLKDEILAYMAQGPQPMTATDIANGFEGKYSVNKISAMLTQLKEDNSVIRTVEKRKAYFTLA